MDEQKQWQLFLSGDEQALSSIFRTYHDDLFNYGMKLAGNTEIVKDAIQEMFLKLWKNRKSLSETSKIKPYLLKALRRHIEDCLSIYNRYYFTDKPLLEFEVQISTEDFIINEQVTEENQKKVLEVLSKLSPRQREAIYLRFFENLEFENIALVMDMNVQSVRNTLHRAMQTLREMMILEAFILLIGERCLFPYS
jgi:RNA polymerase sigma-70 factor (ECF subfamily)